MYLQTHTYVNLTHNHSTILALVSAEELRAKNKSILTADRIQEDGLVFMLNFYLMLVLH